jgi:hypothetical protein
MATHGLHLPDHAAVARESAGWPVQVSAFSAAAREATALTGIQ